MPTVSVNDLKNSTSSEYTVNEGEVLFDALDAQGTVLPHGCLAGSCGSCRILVLSGDEHLSPMSAIEKDTIEHIKASYIQREGEAFLEGKILRLSCRARVLGNCEIAPFK
jgi:ferredoxin